MIRVTQRKEKDMKHTDALPSRRYSLIDAIRGVAVLNMIAFHLCYDIYCVYGVWPQFYLAPWVVVWERLICSSFIIISGISLNFSSHGYRRGITVSLCGLTVTLVTALAMPSQLILYGILTFLGAAMLLTFALRRALNHIPPLWGAIDAAALFALCYGIPKGYIGLFSYPLIHLPESWYEWGYLACLGFPSHTFSSSDYFPLLPWIFLCFFGCFLWRVIRSRGWDRIFTTRVPVLDFVGRHSLIIYLIHQPMLLLVCYLCFGY